ncbi:hypothetical protein CkaCkLH20_02791 [Colletotrichum karsti]|uniref:Uncharacterized protein n=1 Tax=Colletotrichum karsti TaxID=1095194 RepID=A0A9P6IC86_9PEZI|nr:uncharacterized protein CkaCkLH20_02791 [Colletotrichum karsti]KAF9879980.1 hypothetical protein CkaCkLH20_02791 [Colletotrichum karsti]
MDTRFSALREKMIQNQDRWYYRGLPTGPTFLARAPNPPWDPKIVDDMGYYDYQGDPVKKTLRPVCRHPIVEKWNNTGEIGSLRFEILRSLEAVDWNSVDIFRCGYEDDKDLPVVLMVSVQPGSISPAQARDAAARCEHVLGLHGLTDVSCELRASEVFRLQKSPSHQRTPRFWWGSREYQHQLTNLLGTTISAANNPASIGTKGPYLRVKMTDGDKTETSICALTCRHSLFGNEKAPSLSQAVVQPGDYDRMLARIESDKSSSKERIDKYEERSSSGGCVLTTAQENNLRRERETLAEINRLWASYTALGDIEARTFGHVCHIGDGRHFKSDWALIRLDGDKHEQPLASLRNQVSVASESHKFKALKWQSLFWDDAKPDEDDIVTLAGPVPLAEFQLPDFDYLEDAIDSFGVCQCPSTLVLGKYGHSSDLTFGLANQAFSVIRHKHPGARDLFSLAIGVTGYEHRSMSCPPCATSFCRTGDSGACVWDFKGRVAGIVTAGSGSDPERDVTDVTYITPMEWILEDMKACGLEATLCE